MTGRTTMRHKLRQRARAFALGTASLLIAATATAQTTPPPAPTPQPGQPAQIAIRGDQAGPTYDRRIFTQFAEHLGNGIYGGLWVGNDRRIPNTRGFRTTSSRRSSGWACRSSAGPAAASPTSITGARASAHRPSAP